MKCIYALKGVDLALQFTPPLQCNEEMLVSKDLHHIPGKSTFDERWLKSVGISAALPHIANPVVDSSVGTACLYSDLIKTLTI